MAEAVKYYLVPLMSALSGVLMAFAWIGHLRFKEWSFMTALLLSWLIVLPEYLMNVFSARWGRPEFTGGEIAAMHLASGVVSVALISKFFLDEPMSTQQLGGFMLMAVAVLLIIYK
jgi:uncharacterized protein